MKPATKKYIRTLHRWLSIITALPLIIVCISGLFLQLKKDIHWIQPQTVQGSGTAPGISFDTLLDSVSTVPEAEIRSWKDVDRIDARPDKGIAKVRAKNSYEIQIDIKTGEILQTAVRRTDFIEKLHDGSFFHNSAKYWIFLPSALLTLLLWGTGIFLYIFKKSKSLKD